MIIKTKEELEGITKAGHAVAITLKKMREYARPGMSTHELDLYGKEVLDSFGAVSAPIQDYSFPGHTCISLNREVCHGIPSPEVFLKEGDLVNVDVSAILDGFYGDNGGSFILGEDTRGLQPLVDASRKILHLAMEGIRSRVRISDIGALIHKEARKRGFTVIKNLCGHGVGRKLHEEPREIACFRDRMNRERFRRNSVIALETFISTKGNFVRELSDGWTMVNKEGFVAQHEHTIVVTDGKPVILTKANGI